MDPSRIAKLLGSRGGKARARRLSAEERRRIASMGGKARMRSLALAQRIKINLRYANAVIELKGGALDVKSVSTFAGPLPGIYPGK
jgi:hypothetical protein